MKKVILAIAMTSLSVAAMAQAKELKVAIDPTYEPFTFKTPDGKPTGVGQHDPRFASQKV